MPRFVEARRYAWNANKAVGYRVDDAIVALTASSDYDGVMAATPVPILNAGSPHEIDVVRDLLAGLYGLSKIVDCSSLWNSKLDKGCARASFPSGR